MEELKKQLDTALWKSKGSRFKTYHKYKSIYNILKFFNTFLSFILICISIVTIGKFQIPINTDIMNILLLIIAIYIFTISIYLPTLELKVKILFDNATEISYLLRKLKIITTIEELSKLSDDYLKLEKVVNHDELDYKIWCSLNNCEKASNCFIKEAYIIFIWNFYAKFPILIFIGFLYILYKIIN